MTHASNQNKNNQHSSGAEWLINEVINGNAVLFHDERNEAYIALDGNGSNIVRIESNRFKEWLNYYHFSHTGKPLPKDTDTRVAHTLAAYAIFEGQEIKLGVRLVKNDDGLWYDLGDGSAVRITVDGWQIVENPPILFRRFQHQKAQVHPEPGGEIGLLWHYINVDSDDDWLLFLANLLTAFIPGFPHPILILYGPQGAGKTTPMRVMKEFIDPSSIKGLPLLKSGQNFAQIADHHAFLFFDNLSGLPTSVSDSLARASTGDGFSKRRHYTNDDDFVYQIQLPLALNGINQPAIKPDLLDRAILINLKRIAPEERMSEKIFWEGFYADKPKLLGAIFDVLAKALALYPDVEISDVPRMADFSYWGCAAIEAAGYEQYHFLDAYFRNIGLQTEWAIEASPVAQAVIEFMEERASWEGTASELLSLLDVIATRLNLRDSRYWPGDPVHMGRKINEAHTTLSSIGIHIDKVKTSEARLIVITKEVEASADTAVPPEDVNEETEPEKPTAEQQKFLDDDEDSKAAKTVKH